MVRDMGPVNLIENTFFLFVLMFDSCNLIGPILYLICVYTHMANQSLVGPVAEQRSSEGDILSLKHFSE